MGAGSQSARKRGSMTVSAQRMLFSSLISPTKGVIEGGILNKGVCPVDNKVSSNATPQLKHRP